MATADPATGPTRQPLHPARKRTPRWAWGLLAAVLLLAWFGTLDFRHLVRSDEGRYAEIAREMWVSGDWVTIRYNGLKYFEKPPLHLWMTAMAYHFFGLGEWQARLWVALSGALGVGALVLAARRWHGPQAGWMAGLVLLSTPSWVIAAHFNSLDMSVAGVMTVTLAAFLLAQHPGQKPGAQRGWMLLAWAAMGAAVLTKGLIGIVLPGAALVLYTLLTRDWALWRRLHLLGGSLVLLAVTAPWFVWVSVRNPEFAQFFFVHEHFQRYTSAVHQRSAPVWYFVPQLLLGFLPWLALTPRWLRLLREGGLTRPAPDADSGWGFKPDLFCAAWAGVIFVFFSLSGSKLPGYIVPLFPALAWLAARALWGLDSNGWRRQLVWMGALAALGLIASAAVARLGGTPDLQHYGQWLLAACCVALGLLWLAAVWQRQGRVLLSQVAAGLAFFAAASLGLLGHETLGRAISGVDLVPAVQARLSRLPPDTVIYGVRLLDHTLPFYLQRSLVMVEEPDELAFGVQQEPARWVPSVQALRPIWEKGPAALAVMSHDTHAQLLAAGWPLHTVAQDERRFIVSNREQGTP